MKKARGTTKELLKQILEIRECLDMLDNQLRNDRDPERLSNCKVTIEKAHELCNEKLNMYYPVD